MMNEKIWKPSSERKINSEMYRFMQYINAVHGTRFEQYQDLYTWSVNNLTDFWIAIWNFCNIKAARLWEQVLLNPQDMFTAKWFTESTLNFAENLLTRDDDKLAIIFQNENGERRTLTYHELKLAVQKVANALKKAGITISDRVVGYLPNIPETIIAMLATNSLGAIWSSCSPDFGVHAVVDRFKQITPKILFAVDGYRYQGKIHSDIEKVADIAKQLPSLQQTILIPYLNKSPDIKSIPNVQLYNDFINNAPNSPLTFRHLPFDHPAFILFSSGTTGQPKCIVHSAGGTLIQLLKELKLHTDITAKDIVFYYTTSGWMMWNWFTTSLALGATIVLYDGSPFFSKPERLFDLIAQEKISIFGTSAKYISALEKHKLNPARTHNLSSLKTILSTGSPLLPENFDYVYQKIKPDVCLSSISGGTDIISCFALGNPLLPVYRGELQCIGLGLKVAVFDEQGHAVENKQGELVCTAPFPSMPIYFWNDADKKKYHQAYFEKFRHVWAHGDYAEITPHHGVIIYGRSDATLKPAGIRIGTAEIYNEVEQFAEVSEALAVAQNWDNNVRIILFVKLVDDLKLNNELQTKIKTTLRENLSPHHVPAKIIQVPDIPRTFNNKIAELAVREIIHGREVKNKDALANPEVLDCFRGIEELKEI